MDANELLIIVAFIAGALLSSYILTHLKQVIEKVNKWRATSIAALCISAFLFFAISHPKITKVVADVFGAKVELNALNKKIKEKQTLVSDLDSKIVSAQSELVTLQTKIDDIYIAQISKPMAESLRIYQKERKPVAVFPGNQIAVNTKLAAKAAGTTDIPEKFRDLPADSWIIIQNGAITLDELNSQTSKPRKAATMKTNNRPDFVLQLNGEAKQVAPLTNAESTFLRGLILKNSKQTD